MGKDEYTDEQLVTMIQNGVTRDEALKYIFFKWFDEAKRRVLYAGCQVQDVADIIDEAIIVLDQKIRFGEYIIQPSASLKSYYLSICYWQCQKWRNKQKPKDALPIDLPWPGTGPEEETLNEEKIRLVRKALGELDEKCRIALEMWAERYPLTDIAKVLAITYDYTKQLLFTCRKKLGDKLRRLGLD